MYERLFLIVWSCASHKNYYPSGLLKTFKKKVFETNTLWEVLVNIVWLKQCVSNYYCGLQSTTLTLHYSGRQLRMNFISTVAQWDKFFVFLLCIRFFLFGSLLGFGELWYQLFQGSLFQDCVLAVSGHCGNFQATRCPNLSAKHTGFPYSTVLIHKVFLLWMTWFSKSLFWLHCQYSKFDPKVLGH